MYWTIHVNELDRNITSKNVMLTQLLMVDSEEAKFNFKSIYIFVATWCDIGPKVYFRQLLRA